MMDDQTQWRSPSGRATHERSQSPLSPPAVGVPNADERWSLTFYGSPPAATVWAGLPGFPDSRRELVHICFASRQQRNGVGSALSMLVDEHNAALAIATEAQRAETVKLGSVHEGAGPQDIAQGPSQ